MSSLLNRKLYSNSGDLKLPAAMSVLKEKILRGSTQKGQRHDKVRQIMLKIRWSSFQFVHDCGVNDHFE